MILPRGAMLRLRRADPMLGLWIQRIGPCRLVTGEEENALAALVRSLVYQQLSGKAAATIFSRFRAIFPMDAFPSPRAILAIQDEQFQESGLSRQKISYLRELCETIQQGTLSLGALPRMGDEEVISTLTRIKGVGRWTAQMFLIFHLGRLDIWPADDLGIRKGLARLLAQKDLPDARVARVYGDRYQPYRTIAAWYFWRIAEEPT